MTNSSMSYVAIASKLILGSCPESSSDVELLKSQLGVTAVLNLQTDDDMKFLEMDWSAINRQYVRSKVQLRRIPIIDFDRVDLLDQLPRGIRALHSLMHSGNTTYVHCTAGASRAPTTIVAYLYWFCGWELLDAANHVKSLRICSPDTETIERASRNFGPRVIR
jgi:protein-tyrosine phosphatase